MLRNACRGDVVLAHTDVVLGSAIAPTPSVSFNCVAGDQQGKGFIAGLRTRTVPSKSHSRYLGTSLCTMRFERLRGMSYSRRAKRNQRPARLLNSRSLPALISSITLVVVLVTSSTASAESSPQAPVALAGSTNGVSLDGAEFDVELWPRDDVERELTLGDAVPTLSLPQDVVSARGTSFEIRLNPDDVPAGYVHEDGRVHVSVVVIDSQREQKGSVFSTVSHIRAHDNPGVGRWVDPMSPLVESEASVTEAQLVGDSSAHPVRVSVNMTAVPELPRSSGRDFNSAGTHNATSSSDCKHGWVLKANSDRKATIARTFVPNNTKSTAWAYHGSNRNLKMGVAVGAWTDGEWERGGSKTFGSGISFKFAKNRANKRIYRVETRYGRYVYQYSYPAYNVCSVIERKWQPRFNTGGFVARSRTKNPPWAGNCRDVPAGTWKRTHSSGSSFRESGGVLIYNIIGFRLSSERQYNSSAHIAYNVAGKKRVCGNNDLPARASKVRLRWR